MHVGRVAKHYFVVTIHEPEFASFAAFGPAFAPSYPLVVSSYNILRPQENSMGDFLSQLRAAHLLFLFFGDDC